LTAVIATAIDGEPLTGEHWVVGVSPARMADGRVMMWHPPHPIAFNLLEAQRFAERGARKRVNIVSKLARREGGTYGPANDHAALDCLCDLDVAVLFAYTAIESLANHAIDMLPDDATIKAKGKTLAKDDLIWLATEEKLKRVLPELEHGQAIAGDAHLWRRFQRLRSLRHDLFLRTVVRGPEASRIGQRCLSRAGPLRGSRTWSWRGAQADA
jgi:hypothetical protein